MRLLSALVVSVFVSMLAVVGPAQSGTVTVEITGNGTGTFNGNPFSSSPFDFHLVGPDGGGNVVDLTTATVSINGGSFNTFTDPMHIGLHFGLDYAFFGYQAPGPDLIQLTFLPADFTALTSTNSFSGAPTGFLLAFSDVPTSGGPLSFTDFDLRGLNLSAVSTGSGSQTPLPAALPLFASGLGVMGLLARRRKRKAAIAAAA
jgi:hypothetical protein